MLLFKFHTSGDFQDQVSLLLLARTENSKLDYSDRTVPVLLIDSKQETWCSS